MIDDTPGLDPAEAMDACVAAKNCTVNVYGYSPIQLAFGYAPTIPYFPLKGDEARNVSSLQRILEGSVATDARCEDTSYSGDGEATTEEGTTTSRTC